MQRFGAVLLNMPKNGGFVYKRLLNRCCIILGHFHNVSRVLNQKIMEILQNIVLDIINI